MEDDFSRSANLVHIRARLYREALEAKGAESVQQAWLLIAAHMLGSAGNWANLMAQLDISPDNAGPLADFLMAHRRR
jgi:hypothetical protein